MASGDGDSSSSGELDMDFSVTESGRTIAHMVQAMKPQEVDDFDFSVSSSGRTVEHFLANMPDMNHLPSTTTTNPRPIPPPNNQGQPHGTTASLGGESPGVSAFLSGLMNTGGGLLSHTPPTGLATSYEASHFGKRPRSGSVSGRLRSASELEERGLIDRQQKAVLKDLIISGDEELQAALDLYETGDSSALEDMIRKGALSANSTADIDLLGDLDLDFLQVHDDIDLLDTNPDMIASAPAAATAGTSSSMAIPMRPPPSLPTPSQMHQMTGPNGAADPASAASNRANVNNKGGQAISPHMVSPSYDDGIGDLEFTGDFATTDDYSQPDSYANDKPESVGSSTTMEQESRLRSNSLFSALLSDPQGQGESQQYGGWMDRYPNHKNVQIASNHPAANQGVQIASPQGRVVAQPSGPTGIGASLEQHVKTKKKNSDSAQKNRLEKKSKPKKQREKKQIEEEPQEHVSGSGMPRSMSDPNFRTSLDENGLLVVDRPDGWIGAYSPESRKVRIGRFLEKRNHRVWTKTVKYDVRKNFADSRLRVKGRFVKKEDELLMRDLMSLT